MAKDSKTNGDNSNGTSGDSKIEAVAGEKNPAAPLADQAVEPVAVGTVDPASPETMAGAATNATITETVEPVAAAAAGGGGSKEPVGINAGPQGDAGGKNGRADTGSVARNGGGKGNGGSRNGNGGGNGRKAPPRPDDGPPTSNAAGRPLVGGLTLQPVVLIGFLVLAIAIALISFVTVIPLGVRVDPASAYRILTVLVTAAAVCVGIAWLDRDNAQLLGRGLADILDVHRAALTGFVIASVATIGVSIFVALSSLFAGGPEDGVFALASIEFLLKLTAVSAIIVLITLRKSGASQVMPDNAAADEPKSASATGQGEMQFGGAAFAFSLIVIAALIIPRDDILRIWSFVFGSEKKLEDYLPRLPSVAVDDDLPARIGTTVVSIVSEMETLRNKTPEQLNKELGVTRLEAAISTVLAESLLRRVEGRGAWPLLRAVCGDTEDTLLFAHSDDRILAEHLDFLSTEGIVEYPYGDQREIGMSEYGRRVLREGRRIDCKRAPEDVAQIETLVDAVPFTKTLPVTGNGTTFRLQLEPGDYLARLVSGADNVDPKLELRDSAGTTIAINNDETVPEGERATRDSRLEFEATRDPVLVIASSGAESGTATFSLEVSLPRYSDPLWVVAHSDNVQSFMGEQNVTVPGEGTVLTFTPPTPGSYIFDVSTTAEDGADLVASVVTGDPNKLGSLEVVASNDTDYHSLDRTNDPRVMATMEAGKPYYLAIVQYSSRSPGGTEYLANLRLIAPGDETPIPTLESRTAYVERTTPEALDSGFNQVMPPAAVYEYVASSTGEHSLFVRPLDGDNVYVSVFEAVGDELMELESGRSDRTGLMLTPHFEGGKRYLVLLGIAMLHPDSEVRLSRSGDGPTILIDLSPPPGSDTALPAAR